MCSTPWANSIRKARQNWSQWKPQWPTVAEAAYWQPPKKPNQDSESTTAEQGPASPWSGVDSVPEEVQKNLKEAGYKPPKAQVKEEVDDLADLCQKHEAALVEEVKAYLKGLKASQEVMPSQAASQASQSWQSAAGKLKHIADQKIDLQKRIDMAKESLRQLLQEMIVLNEQAERAQKAVEASSGLLKERVFCETAADMEVDSILQELGGSLNEEQERKLHEIQAEREAKRRRTQEVPTPPGLEERTRRGCLPEMLMPRQGLARWPRDWACGAWSPKARAPQSQCATPSKGWNTCCALPSSS